MSDDKVEYTFNSRGIYTGDVTGEQYSYRDGQSIVAPKGEFENENPAFYETRPLRPSSEGASSEEEEMPDDGVYHSGAGWYLVRVGGETVDKVRGKEDAEEQYLELTTEE